MKKNTFYFTVIIFFLYFALNKSHIYKPQTIEIHYTYPFFRTISFFLYRFSRQKRP
jgi:hypothetical protein